MKNRLRILLFPVFIFLCSSTIIAQEFGIASIYQDKFHGKTTVYGRTYNRNELVAAHKKHLPGTFIKVTRLDNKKTVTVEVIDRGPFVKGRIIDLSSRAAKVLGMEEEGVANVKLEVVQRGKPIIETIPQDAVAERDRDVPSSFDTPTSNRINTEPVDNKPAAEEKKVVKTLLTEPKKPETLTSKGSDNTADKKPTDVLVGNSFTFYGLYKLEVNKADKANFGVQVAYLTNFEGLLKQVSTLQAKKYSNMLFNMEKDAKGVLGYKVIFGPFETQDQAKNYQKELSGKGVKGFVVAAGENYESNTTYQIQLKRPIKTDFGVQVASLTNEEGVMKQVADLQAKWFDNTLVSIEKAEDGSAVYKVILGPFETEDKAATYKSSLSRKHRIKGFVVALN